MCTDAPANPLSEASLLGICLSHRDGSAMREKGLVLRRTRQQKYRKNMEEFFGDTPPPATSPTSPTYYGPRLGRSDESDPNLLTPPRAPSKKTNRASTVSVMSGLGVMAEPPPSPSGLRVPPSGSFLSKGRKMYNFFGHRPPSELIANHLGEYFPSAKRKELEKSRHSMLRMSTGPPRRTSVVPSERSSSDTKRDSVSSTPRRSQQSHRSTLSSPPAAPIPEEGEDDIVPRLSVSSETGAKVDLESDADSNASVDSKPPLLPPFVPSKESLSDQLVAYSPLPQPNRPKSVHVRRGSGGSAKSRMSMLSQLRRNRDRSDTASMLTVDEITAEVENRRASTITFDESDEDVPAPPPVVDPGLVPRSEVEEGSEADEEESSEEDEENSEEEEDDDDAEDDHGKAFTSTGCELRRTTYGLLLTLP